MLSDWSAACSADDPVLVVPWSDPANPDVRFVDLRENPYDLDHLPEAERFPPLLHALRALNAQRSPVFTAKCDAWRIEAPANDEELEGLRLELDLIAEDAPTGFASYIDVLWRERSVFASFHQQEQIVHRVARKAAFLHHPYAMLDMVIRPALIDLISPEEGFAISVYIKALGHDASAAEENWASALDAIVGLIRSKELVFG
jgi:hypothetical protein